MKNIIVLILATVCGISIAEDLGSVGRIYPVAEPDMIEWIKSKAATMMKNGEWDNIQKKAIQDATNKVKNPPAIANISDATVHKEWFYTPYVDVSSDIKDTKGNVIAKAGRYNALRYKPMDVRLVFINGNNEKQVEWALAKNNESETRTKIVLTQGSFMDLDKKHRVWFYYDQNGTYTSKLNIKHVPALVEQDGLQIKITELTQNEI